MIYELLGQGSENAKTGRELAHVLDCDIRTITEQIERERRAGYPICANMRGDNAGYFLAETPEELEQYCARLYKRGNELFKTRRALLAILERTHSQRVSTAMIKGLGALPQRAAKAACGHTRIDRAVVTGGTERKATT